jgi:hypothetical protein
MLHFTKQLSGLLIVGTILFFACRSSSISPDLPPDYIAIQAGASVQTSAGPTASADSVSVSICPENANCFAPNSATVVLRLSKGAQSQPVKLFAWIPNYNRRLVVPTGLTDSTSVELEGQRYKVILRDGKLLTNSGIESLTKGTAIVQVSKL